MRPSELEVYYFANRIKYYERNWTETKKKKHQTKRNAKNYDFSQIWIGKLPKFRTQI